MKRVCSQNSEEKDLRAKARRTTMSIETLPDNVLAKVLEKCEPSERDKLELVSPQWKSVVDRYQGIVLVKGLASHLQLVQPEDSLNRSDISTSYFECIQALVNVAASAKTPSKVDSKETLDKSSSESVESKDVVEVEEKVQVPQVVQDTTLPELKTGPEYIRKLSFVGLIPLTVSAGLISSCKNLLGLHLHISTISGVELPKESKLTLDIPTLKTFIIDSCGVKEEAARSGQNPCGFINFGKIYQAVGSLLNDNNFLHLETLMVDLPYCPQKENLLVCAVTGFLFRHRECLQSFCYHQSFMVNLDEDDDDENEVADEAEELENEEGHVSIKSLAYNAVQLKSVFLTDIHIRVITEQDSSPLWKNFLFHQKEMRTLIHTGNSRLPFPSATLRDNGSTLCTLVLDLRDNVDLACLKEFQVLKKLALLTKANYDDTEDDSDAGESSAVGQALMDANAAKVKNIQFLPVSLESLTIRHFKIERNEADGLLLSERLGKLKQVELFDCGTEGNFGVSLKTIGSIWEQKRFHQFSIVYSLNRNSLSETPLPESIAFLAFVIKGGYSVSDFEVRGKLDPAGERYENVSEVDVALDGSIRLFAEQQVFKFAEEPFEEGSDVISFGEGDEDEQGDDTETEGSNSDDEYETVTEDEEDGSSGSET